MCSQYYRGSIYFSEKETIIMNDFITNLQSQKYSIGLVLNLEGHRKINAITIPNNY